MWTTSKRIFRAGFLNFWRNGFVTLSSILMMTVMLFELGLIFFTGVMLNATLADLRSKADMSIYLVPGATDDQIAALQKQLQSLPEVSSVTYTSASDELIAFQARNQNDQLELQAIDELGQNPLGGVLEVRAQDISQYDTIAQYLQGQDAVGSSTNNYVSIIDRVSNFDVKTQQAIQNLSAITASAEKIGFIIILILVLTTIAISFNTIRLAIYTAREEIAVMRLVGAGRGYIRMPFVVEGVMYGVFAGLLALGLFYPMTWWLGSKTEQFLGGINVFSYYMSHFGLLFLLMVGSGAVLGALASFLAVRRYLKV